MWAIIKYDKKFIEILKREFKNKIDKDVKFYNPKISIQKFKKNKLIYKEYDLLGDYLFCYHKNFENSKNIINYKYTKGLKYFLEGYKLADKMAARNIGGSTFSDWWAYKYEVEDAIPYNAAIMNSQGVTVAINSDDAEMSRRLNQEAAKTMKYGGVSEEEAWKFVTLNPAKLLHIDDKVGSIKEGKDADLVLWSDHPLSVYAKPEKTMIEGVVYFDIARDKAMREKLQKQKSELITQMLQAKNKGMKTQPIVKKEKIEAHCDTMEAIR